MGELLMVERETFECSSFAIFDAIGSGALPGWRLAGDSLLRVGTPITLPLKLPRTMGGRQIEVVGRVAQVVPGRKLVVVYQSPWRGSVSIYAKPMGVDKCQVKIVAQLDDQAVAWLMHAGGWMENAGHSSKSRKLGLLVSNSGPANIFAAASENLARLAVEELNSIDGFGAQNVELHVGDDGTDPLIGAAELIRLVRIGCRVVLTNVTSATFLRLRPIARKLGVLLIYTPVNEGGSDGPEVFRLGERPISQLRNNVPMLMRITGGKNWYLTGNDYSWPRTTNRCAHRVIGRRGGYVVGERYEPLGSRDFASLLESIEGSRAELIVSTFVGADSVAFERQFFEAGLRSHSQTLALALDESTQEHIGATASTGVWSSFGYFQALDTQVNIEFLARYRARFGNDAPPVSSISESIYEAVHIYADAIRRVGSDEAMLVKRQLCSGASYSGPRGVVHVGAAGIAQPMYLGRADGRGIGIVDVAI